MLGEGGGGGGGAGGQFLFIQVTLMSCLGKGGWAGAKEEFL